MEAAIANRKLVVGLETPLVKKRFADETVTPAGTSKGT
jgi:hypothetical protein